MDHRVDVRAPAEDFGMDVVLYRWRYSAADIVAVKIDHDDVVDPERAAHRSAGVDQDLVRIRHPRAEMSVEVDDLRALHHQDRVDQLLLQVGDTQHSFAPARQSQTSTYTLPSFTRTAYVLIGTKHGGATTSPVLMLN